MEACAVVLKIIYYDVATLPRATYTKKHRNKKTQKYVFVKTIAALVHLWDGDLLDNPQTTGQLADHTVEFTQT